MATLQRIGETFYIRVPLRRAAVSPFPRRDGGGRSKGHEATGRIDVAPDQDRPDPAAVAWSRRTLVCHQRRKAGRQAGGYPATDSDAQGDVGTLPDIAADRSQGRIVAQDREGHFSSICSESWERGLVWRASRP